MDSLMYQVTLVVTSPPHFCRTVYLKPENLGSSEKSEILKVPGFFCSSCIEAGLKNLEDVVNSPFDILVAICYLNLGP